MKKFIITAALTTFMVSPAALAQDELTFISVDANDSATISFQEIRSAAPDVTTEIVESYDIDDNDVLTWSEFQKWKAGDDPAYRRDGPDNDVNVDALEIDGTDEAES